MPERNAMRDPVIVAGIVINIFVLALGAWVLAGGDDAFVALTREDGFIEWMQFVAFAALAALLGFVAADRFAQQRRWTLESLGLAALTALVALAALEEISWFQRVLGVASPDFFMQHNRQYETNLHNLVVADVNVHKQILIKIIFIAGLLHNLVLPLVARRRPGVRTWVESLGLYLPPLAPAIVYLVLVALAQGLLEHPRRGEIGETLGAIHYLATSAAAYCVGVGYGRPIFTGVDARRISVLGAIALFYLVLTAWLLAAGWAATAS